MQPGSVRPASLPYRLERQAKSRPVLWRATAARREVARCGQRRRDRSFSYRTDQLDSAELVIKMERRHLDGDVGNGGWLRGGGPAPPEYRSESSSVRVVLERPRELRLRIPHSTAPQAPYGR